MVGCWFLLIFVGFLLVFVGFCWFLLVACVWVFARLRVWFLIQFRFACDLVGWLLCICV